MSALIIVAVGEDHQQYELGVLFRLGRVLGVREPELRVIIPFARTNKIEHPRDGNRNPRLQRAGGDRRLHGISGVMEAISVKSNTNAAIITTRTITSNDK